MNNYAKSFGSFSVLLLVFFLYAERSEAAPFLVCNDCGYASVEAKAVTLSPPLNTFSDVYVGDFLAGNLWQCQVWREPEIYPPATMASCFLAPPQLQLDFTEISEIVALASKEIEIDYPGGDIYEISGCAACARHWLLSNQGALASRLSVVDILRARSYDLAAQIGIPGNSISVAASDEVRVKLVLKNDSSGALEKGFCMADLTGNGFVVDVDSCVDGDGNPIPTLNSPNVQVTYAFSSGLNLDRMVVRLRAIGRPVSGTGSVEVRPLISCTSSECEADEPIGEDDSN